MSAVVSTRNSHSILRASGRPLGGLVYCELTAGRGLCSCLGVELYVRKNVCGTRKWWWWRIDEPCDRGGAGL